MNSWCERIKRNTELIDKLYMYMLNLEHAKTSDAEGKRFVNETCHELLPKKGKVATAVHLHFR